MLFRSIYSISDTTIKMLLPRFARVGYSFEMVKAFLLNIVGVNAFYDSQRVTWIFNANSTGQVMVLENLLNQTFDPTLRRIYISGSTDTNAIRVALNITEDSNLYFGVSDSGDPANTHEAVPLFSESTGVMYDFVVFYPAGMDTIRLRDVIEFYKIQ